jgi:hypothetical protein
MASRRSMPSFPGASPAVSAPAETRLNVITRI